MLPKITTNNTEKKDEEKTRVLFSREKNSRKEKEENHVPVLMTQSEIRKNSENSKPQQSEISKPYLKQLPEEKETVIRQSKQDLDDIFKTKTIGLVGLCNIGNTCFMYVALNIGIRFCNACSTCPNSMTISYKTCTHVRSAPTEEWLYPTGNLSN